jgi:hypothetical protein
MKKFAKPWQAMPSQIISLSLIHAKKNTDFDHQLAFLLLDVGVESALKTYLINKKQDVEKIGFPDLLNRVGDEISKEKLQIPLDEIEYFHKIRNKLYHQGDGIKPTGENLEKYAELAKILLKVLLDIDVSKEQESIQPNVPLFSLSRIQKNIMSLQSNSSFVVEYLYPQIATRKSEAQLRYIRTNTGPDDESDQPSVRAEFVQRRIDAFNEITGWEFTEDDYEFIEYMIDNPEQLHVWLAFQELGDGWHEDWKKYQDAVYFLRREQNKVNIAEDKKYEEVYKWTHEKAHIVCQWLKSRIPDIEPKEPDSYYPPMNFDS